MQNFTYWNPTKLIFGKGEVEKLPEEIKPYGKNVLLVYGGGSIKRSGLYDQVTELLKKAGVTVHELAGVEPNPRVSTVNKGVALCKENSIDFLLAVGGGSVIDCTKAIAAGAKYDGDAWDIVTKKHQPKEALPFGTVLTLAATGSEMNSGSVITNWETQEKYGWGSPLVYPKFSILDPVNTFTVPKDHTIYGMVDMMSHVFEQYFHHTSNTPYQDRMCESLLRTVIETAPKLINDLENYELRETILYTGTIALNGMLSMGARGDWYTQHRACGISGLRYTARRRFSDSVPELDETCAQRKSGALNSLPSVSSILTRQANQMKRSHLKESAGCLISGRASVLRTDSLIMIFLMRSWIRLQIKRWQTEHSDSSSHCRKKTCLRY